MLQKFAVLFIINFCHFRTVGTTFPPSTPYFIDEKLEQSVVYQSMDRTENEYLIEVADLLGLKERPKRIKKPLSLRNAASKFLLELYNSLQEEEEPQLSAYHNRAARSTLTTRMDRMEVEGSNNIITFSGKMGKGRRTYGPSMTITFNTNYVSHDLRLLRAELRIFQNSKLGRMFKCEKNVTVSLFKKVINHQMQKIDLSLVSKFTTTTSHKGWLQVNVTKIVSKWLFRGYTPNGHDLIISISLPKLSNEILQEQEEFVTPEDIGFVNVGGNEEYQPFIIGYFNGPDFLQKIQNMRFKRDIRSNRKLQVNYNQPTGEGEGYKLPKTCERMNFSIDFTDLQMQDWVIAPKKFEAYFCAGECNFPLGSKMNATNHAIVQTLMHLKQPNLPKPCCVPTVLGSISILHHINEDSVNLSKYPNSVAKSCGCH